MTKIDHQMPQEISTRVKIRGKMHFGSGQTHLHLKRTIRLVVPVNATFVGTLSSKARRRQ